MKRLVRKNVFSVNAYVAGKPIEETKRELKLRTVIKLASNENPLGASPKAVAAMRRVLSGVNRYPDSNSFFLKRKIAQVNGLSPAQVVLGNGSDELIDVVIKTFVEDDENIVTSEGTFLEYGIIAQINNRQVRTAPLKYFKYDLEALRRRIDRKTKLVFIANPNNPTGTYVTKTELNEFLDDLPDSALVVLDEAYDAFIDVADFPDSLALLRRRAVVVLKTFSKAYGLAGARLGYALAHPELAGYLERVRQPFNVNLLAQAAGLAALDDRTFLSRTRRAVLDGKHFLYAEFSKLGLAYVPSVANFILVDVGLDGVAVFREMLRYGVIVRDMKQYALGNFIRVTVGTKQENRRLVRVLRTVLRKVPVRIEENRV